MFLKWKDPLKELPPLGHLVKIRIEPALKFHRCVVGSFQGIFKDGPDWSVLYGNSRIEFLTNIVGRDSKVIAWREI